MLTFPTSNVPWGTFEVGKSIPNLFQIEERVTHVHVPFIQPNLSHQILYPVLPALLDSNPFRESPDLVATAGIVQVPGSGLRVPGEIQHLADVLTETWRLLRDCQLPPEISSQLVGYLFYFINASLFNLLMERGTK